MRAELRERIAAAARRSVAELRVHVVPRVPIVQQEEEEESRQTLSRIGIRVGERIAEHPEETIEERCDALGMDRNEEGEGRDELRKFGLFETAGKWGKLVFSGATKKGEEWARERGFPIPPEKGSPLHRAGRLRIERDLGAAIPGTTFDYLGPFNDRQADLQAQIPGGARIAIQVCVTNKPDYEAQCLIEFAQEPLLDGVLLVAVSKEKAGRIRRAVEEKLKADQELAGKEEVRRKIRIVDGGTAFRPGFDWRQPAEDILGRQLDGEEA